MTGGPLTGIKIVEFDGLGPTPFAAMTLADMGADVIRIVRPGARNLLGLDYAILNRGRGFIELDLKNPADKAKAIELVNLGDGLIEGMRPGVMERLGLGPSEFKNENPKLVYGRMTGWGQHGPLAQAAGHDINYIALSGALHAIGGADAPVPPLNLLGDFGGGAMYLAFGMVCAFLEARTSGRGQVIDAAIVDGTAHLMSMIYGMQQAGLWQDRRAANILDGAAPFYAVFECACGGFVSIGSIEAGFYAELLRLTGLTDAGLPAQLSVKDWPDIKTRLAQVFSGRSRDEWCEIMEGSDVCFAPVLTLEQAYDHPHNTARGIFVDFEGVRQPAPAPRFSRTKGAIKAASQRQPQAFETVLDRWRDG